MIRVERVSKDFPEAHRFAAWLRHWGRIPRRRVLDDVSFSVQRGEVFGLLGPNGAGKTTLLKMLVTLTVPTTGRVEIDGLDTIAGGDAVRKRIGYASSDERSFYYRLSARNNMRLFGTLADVPRRDLDRRIEEVCCIVDLDRSLDRRYATFSTGMRQRLSIARALLADAPLLLLDEPTRAVDPLHAQALRTIIRERFANRWHKTIVLATNVLEEAWELCDRIAVLKEGRIVAIGTPAELRRSMGAAQRFFVSVNRIDDALIARIAGVENVLTVEVGDRNGLPLLDVSLSEGTAGLTPFLNAVSCNGVTVTAFESVIPRPAEIFSHLVQGGEEP